MASHLCIAFFKVQFERKYWTILLFWKISIFIPAGISIQNPLNEQSVDNWSCLKLVHKNEGNLSISNFLRALKRVPTWYTYMIATNSLLSDWLQCSESQSERSILWLSCRYIMWVLILKLSKSFYYESDLLFHVHKSWLSTS